MYVMLLMGMIVSAFAFGASLAEFSPLRLVQVIQACAIITLVLNSVAAWKQEGRHAARRQIDRSQPSFRESWSSFGALSECTNRRHHRGTIQ
jgi:BCD family chlorophyll transporter-like MFS transporter